MANGSAKPAAARPAARPELPSQPPAAGAFPVAPVESVTRGDNPAWAQALEADKGPEVPDRQR